jgi:hypothetical protein
VPFDFIRDADLQTAAAPIDFLGINYYETKIAAHDPGEPCHQARVLPPVGKLTAGGLDVRQPASAASCAGCPAKRLCRCSSTRTAPRSTTTPTRRRRG